MQQIDVIVLNSSRAVKDLTTLNGLQHNIQHNSTPEIFKKVYRNDLKC